MAHPKRFEGCSPDEMNAAYRAIGRFITSISDLDAMISAALGAFINGKRKTQAIVLHSIDFNRKREIFKSFSLYLDEGNTPHLIELVKLIDRADMLMKIRHTVAHGMLVMTEGQLTISSMNVPTLLKQAKGKIELLYVDRLDGLSDSADKIAEQIRSIASQLRKRTLD